MTKSKPEKACDEPKTIEANASSGRPQDKQSVQKSLSGSFQRWIETEIGLVPLISTTLSRHDYLGAIKARWGVGRMHYTILPGLYALGEPSKKSPVLVTANYKLSFDTLRKELITFDAWILVLDTKGINVWCAAGKGTFSTKELLHQIEICQLKKIVSHRTLILPQLGAVGVAAHEVKKESGFRVIYGPVRAKDLPEFLATEMKATPEMRRVTFPIRERIKLIPMEIILAAKIIFPSAIPIIVLAGLSRFGFSLSEGISQGLQSWGLIVAATIAGTVFGPTLLPWLPGSSFSKKGFFLGILLYLWLLANNLLGGSIFQVYAFLLLLPTISSFFLMNFTGSSTFTSLSGVMKEMKSFIPIQLIGLVGGIILWLIGQFF